MPRGIFKSRFTDTGKNISDEASHLIAKLVDNHPYYAQQLAQLSWLRTKDVCTVEIVREAHTALVEQLSLLFVTITETLTTQQLNYLKALIAGEKAISSTEIMHRYQISSTTSISRSKAALIKNDILDNKAGEISFQDPIYAYWLKVEYFTNNKTMNKCNRTWIAFANKKRCRHVDAINTLGFISWRMGRARFAIGDIVYLFMSDERYVRFK